MPKALLNIRIAGEGVSPETIKASDLAELLVEAEKAIENTAAVQQNAVPDEALVSLVQISAGRSEELTFALSPAVERAAGVVTQAIATGEYDRLPEPAWSALADISKQAVKRGWEIQFLPNPAIGAVPAVISWGHEVPDPPAAPTATGTTTVYGQCTRVGGAEPKAEILLLDRTTRLRLAVNHAMAKQLGRRLYEEVGIEGEAVWETRGWTIISFRVTRILDYHPGALAEAFKGLADLAGGRWDKVDADDYVRRLRGEDQP